MLRFGKKNLDDVQFLTLLGKNYIILLSLSNLITKLQQVIDSIRLTISFNYFSLFHTMKKY